MTRLRKNILANFLGKSISGVLSLIFIPWYIRLLGAEAYGFVGFYATLQVVLSLADTSLGSAFTRETATLSIQADESQRLRDLSRTFELIFWILGLVFAVLVGSLSGTIATSWVNPVNLSVSAVTTAVLLAGMAIGLQLPFVVYQGGLLGLQRQTQLNVLVIGIGLLRGLGAVLALTHVAATIQVFFAWQVFVSALQLVLGRHVMWRGLPRVAVRPRFRSALLRPMYTFIGGLTITAASGIILLQLDKVVLSRMLTLEQFGYYTLAGQVAGLLGMIASAVYAAIYPRFSQLVSSRDTTRLVVLYHGSCQLVAVLLVPTGMILTFFSKELLLFWTKNVQVTQGASSLVSILAIGQILMGLMLIPYALQLAFGWTRLGIYANVIAIFLLVPSLIWIASSYGAQGASFIWIALYSGQMFVLIPFMHRRILVGEMKKWYIADVAIPFVVPFALVGAARLTQPELASSLKLLPQLGFLWAVAVGCAAVASPATRQVILRQLWHGGVLDRRCKQ